MTTLTRARQATPIKAQILEQTGPIHAVAALAMLPVIVWQGWETLEEAYEGGHH